MHLTRLACGCFATILCLIATLAPCQEKAAAPVRAEAQTSAEWSPYRKLHALCVGINDYRDASIEDLRYAEADAREMAKVLREVYGFETTTLLGNEATREAILNALAALSDASKVTKEDAVIFYFSGHGETVTSGTSEHGYLLPWDAKVDAANRQNAGPLRSSAIRMNDLHNDADAIPARHVLFLMDSCYSGFTADRSAINAPEIAAALSYPARQILTAGTGGEKSYEHPSLGHGVFTSKVLDALTNEKIPFSATKLGAWVKERVPRELQARNVEGRMTPQAKYLSGDGDFYFIPMGASIAPVVLTTPTAQVPAPTPKRKYQTAVSVDLGLNLDLPSIKIQAESQGVAVKEGANYLHMTGVGSMALDAAIINSGTIFVLFPAPLANSFAQLDDAYDTYNYISKQIIGPVEPDLPPVYSMWHLSSMLYHGRSDIIYRKVHVLYRNDSNLTGVLGVPPVKVEGARMVVWNTGNNKDYSYGQNQEVKGRLTSGLGTFDITKAMKPGRQNFYFEYGLSDKFLEVLHEPGSGQFTVSDSARNSIGKPMDANKSIDDLAYPFMTE